VVDFRALCPSVVSLVPFTRSLGSGDAETQPMQPHPTKCVATQARSPPLVCPNYLAPSCTAMWIREIASNVQCVAVCCGVLRCVAVCCSVLQCASVCCRLQSALRCRVREMAFNVQSVAVCCSVLQCAEVCCRMRKMASNVQLDLRSS